MNSTSIVFDICHFRGNFKYLQRNHGYAFSNLEIWFYYCCFWVEIWFFLINSVQIQEIKIFAYQQWLCPTGTTFEPKFLRLFSEVVHHIMYPKWAFIIYRTWEYNLEFQDSIRNLQKRALFMKFYPEMPWNALK